VNSALHLVISTPAAVLVDDSDIRSVRAEDRSGSFGILPNHTDMLTVLPASVVRWRTADDAEHFCAVGGGVLAVSAGEEVAIACRQGVLGNDLGKLAAVVRDQRAEESDADRRARVEQTRFHARAVRQLMRYLRPERQHEWRQSNGMSPDRGKETP
jgi:F-type H+-transporting ATPase subunit epsilon